MTDEELLNLFHEVIKNMDLANDVLREIGCENIMIHMTPDSFVRLVKLLNVKAEYSKEMEMYLGSFYFGKYDVYAGSRDINDFGISEEDITEWTN